MLQIFEEKHEHDLMINGKSEPASVCTLQRPVVSEKVRENIYSQILDQTVIFYDRAR